MNFAHSRASTQSKSLIRSWVGGKENSFFDAIFHFAMEQLKNPIFIVGCPRSGTTLMATMLNRHRNIASSSETLLFNYLAKTSFFENLSQDSLVKPLLEQDRIHEFCSVSGISLDYFERKLTAAVRRGVIGKPKDFLDFLSSLLLEKTGKTRFCEKTPQHLAYVSALLENYPDAQVLCMVRDGRATVLSLLEASWTSDSIVENCRMWTSYARKALGCQKKIPGSQFKLVKYEDIVASPVSVCKEICEYVGEPFDPSMVDNAGEGQVFVEREAEWKFRSTQNVDASRAFRWRKVVSPEDLMLMNFLMEKELREFGYKEDFPRVNMGGSVRIAVALLKYWLEKFRGNLVKK